VTHSGRARTPYIFVPFHNVQMLSTASATAMMIPGDVASRNGLNMHLAISYTFGSGILRKKIIKRLLLGKTR